MMPAASSPSTPITTTTSACTPPSATSPLKDKLGGRDKEIFTERDRKLAEARQRRKQLRQAEHEQPQPIVAPRPDIDFAAVRATVNMAAVLQLLGCQLHARSAQHRGPCPLHGSTSATSRCFSAHLDQGIFHCFKCGRSGNALELYAQATQQTPYDAAIDLCDRLNIPLPTLPQCGTGKRKP
jgi:hypothetical protein